jgi:peroxiredoxin/outer membrane lipoprotein-sorting protein
MLVKMRKLLVLFVATLIPAAAAAAQPQPLQQAPDGPNEPVSPEARSVIERLQAAYAGLETLDLAGSVKANFDVGGEQLDREGEFTASFKAPNKFRHEMSDDILLGSTGETAYVYRPSDRLYMTADAPEERGAAAELPSPIPDLLQMQNPSLLLAISSDAAEHIARGATEVTRVDDVEVDGRSYTTLEFRSPGGDLRLLIDPQTNLIRQVMLDLKAALQAQGQPDVETAQLTFEYTRSEPDVQLDDERFEWSPPPGATDAAQVAAQAQPQDGQPSAELIGQPAPDFTLENLEGEQVKLSDLKGQVVVLDFWATWCAPCIQAMPHLEKMHHDLADQDFRLFTINLREEDERVRDFMQSRNFDLPVLMDREGETAAKYQVGPIPHKVVIGKDGVVRQVFLGYGPSSEPQLREAVNAALQAE